MVSSSSHLQEPALQDALQGIEHKIDNVHGELTLVRGDVAGLKTDVAELKTDVSSLKSDMTIVKGTLVAVERRLDGVQGGLSQLTEVVHRQGTRQEYLIDKVTITMEGLEGGRQHADRRFDEVLAKLDECVQPISLAMRTAAKKEPTQE